MVRLRGCLGKPTQGKNHTGMMLHARYERQIIEGRKRWEGRALRGRAAKVCAGDTVLLEITGHGGVGVQRILRFRVAKVRGFSSCTAMIRSVGRRNLLPDFGNSVQQARALYESLMGRGRYTAWRIDHKSVHVVTRKRKRPLPGKLVERLHWTKQRSMVERGVEQPHLGAAAEKLLNQFGLAMVAKGHSSDQAAQHKDRLRYCARVLKRSYVVPPVASIEKTRQLIKSLPKNIQLHGHLLCSFNWLVKYMQGEPLRPRVWAKKTDSNSVGDLGQGIVKKRRAM